MTYGNLSLSFTDGNLSPITLNVNKQLYILSFDHDNLLCLLNEASLTKCKYYAAA